MTFFKIRSLRNIITISVIIIGVQVSLDLFFIYPSFIRSVTENAEDEAVRLATHLIPELKTTLKYSGKIQITSDITEIIEDYTNDFNLYKLKLFNREGETLYSTDKDDIGKINNTESFHNVINQGIVYSKTVKKDTLSLEGQRVTADVVETYVPIIIKDTTPGALEIYYNVTKRREKLTRQFWISTSLLLCLSIIFLFVVIYVLKNMAINITRREKAQASLKLSEQNYRVLIEGVNGIILRFDSRGKITFLNRYGLDFFGYQKEEIIGRNMQDTILHINKPDHSGPGQLIKDIHNGKLSPVHENENIRKNGQKVWISWTNTPVYNEMNQVEEVLSIGMDITDRKQAKEKIEQTNLKLKDAIDTANEMTRHAEKANRAKSDFLANMSHEIRTPMNGVMGMAAILMETELSSEQLEYANIIRTSCNALLTIINDILDYSKIEAGKIELEHIKFDLRVAIEELSDLVSLQAHKKNLEYISLIRDDVPLSLLGDPGRLRQILINLISNAIKFTHKGEVFVDVMLTAETTTHATIRFNVSDTGIGISKENIKKLFDSFTQADSSTTRKYGGTGLGLTISKKLTELMDGSIGVESEKEKGTTFWFEAVLEKHPEDTEIQPVQLKDIEGKHILIVDSNKKIREVLINHLKEWECRYDEAQDGEIALAKIETALSNHDPFNIAIIDKHIPKMDGKTLGNIIRQDAKLDSTRLIIMTAMGIRGDARIFEQIGFDAYLTKPIKKKHLYDCLLMVSGRYEHGSQVNNQRIITKYTLSENQNRKYRILLVEDNTVNQKVAKISLNKLGFNPTFAINGEEALKILEQELYDIVFMDCQMPVMDGFQATTIIRDHTSKVLQHDIPVIALTAHVTMDNKQKCLDAGMSDYISKPFNTNNLLDIFKKWLTEKDPKSIKNSENDLFDDSDKIFDKTGFLDRVMGDESLASELINDFLEDTPLTIKEISGSLKKGDSAQLERQGHTLKGASANLGALELQKVSYELESAGKAEDLDKANILFSDLEQQFERFKAVFKINPFKSGGNE